MCIRDSYKLTPLEDAFACNFNVLIAGTPKVLGVRQLLEEWTAWRTGSVRRRVYFVMKKKQDKLHLLKGLKRILLDIDKACLLYTSVWWQRIILSTS